MAENETDMDGAAEGTQINRAKHLMVFFVLAAACFAMYAPALDAPFLFDDEPNITKRPELRVETLTARNLWNAVNGAEAKNRVLVSLSFALQYWGAQYLPRITDDEPPRPDMVAWQFRLFNCLVHIFAGFAAYLLFFRLCSLPLAEKHAGRYAWPLAAAAALIWFCSPVQTQAVTYIVQRAASMCAMFYFFGLLAYIECRSSRRKAARAALLGLTLLLFACAVFSKEIGLTFPAAAVMLEYLLIGRFAGWSRAALAAATAAALAIVAAGALWFYGRTDTGVDAELALRRIKADLVDKILEDRIVVQKVLLSPRQRLLTETRVVALYQSLLLWPAPSRLRLDYDFPETLGLWEPDDCRSWADLLPLLLVLLTAAGIAAAPPARRARQFWLLLLLLAAAELAQGLAGYRQTFGLSSVWTRTWPVPALALHALTLGLAALYAYRRPLLSFSLAFFYLANVIESGFIVLEPVFEHRLYLPSAGFYFALTLLALEAFRPAREEDLGPPAAECFHGSTTRA